MDLSMDIKKINKFDQDRMAQKDGFIEVKQINEDGTIEGYGSVSTNIDSYGDRVMPGAFKKTLEDNNKARKKLPILWQHKQEEPIGYWFDSREDGNGLYMRGKLDFNVQRAREAYSLLKNGSISGLSIGFIPVRFDINPESGVRELNEVKLMEVSVVTFPANEAATITQVKNEFNEVMDELNEINQGKVLGYAVALKNAPTASLGAQEPSPPETLAIKLMENPKEENMKVATISVEVPYEDIEEVKKFALELKNGLSSEEGHSDSQADADTVEPQDETKEFMSYLEQKLNEISKHSTSREEKAVPEDGTMMRTSMVLEADSRHRHNYRMGDTQTEVAVDEDGTDHRHPIRYDDVGEPVIVQAAGHDHPAGFPIGPAQRGDKPYDD